MLFLLRPRETWMPYALPRQPEQQRLHNEQVQKAYSSTRRVAPAVPTPDRYGYLKELADLHRAGTLTDSEFEAEKSKLLDAGST